MGKRSSGSIFRTQNGQWRAALSLPNGRRKYYRAWTQAEVRELLERAKSDLRRGLPIVSRQQTAQEFMDRWLANTRSSVRLTTVRQYEQILRLYVVPQLGKLWLSRLQPPDIQNFVGALLTQGLSSRTIQVSLFLLRKALNAAVAEELLHRNPALLVTPPRPARSEQLIPTREQVFKFLDVCKGEYLEAAFILSLALMLRRGEVLALRWSDLDLNNRALTVNQQLQTVGCRRVDGKTSRLILCEPKSRNSYRTIPLPEFVVEALKRHPRRNSELVFATPKGTPVEPRRFDKIFKQILQRAGLPQELKLPQCPPLRAEPAGGAGGSSEDGDGTGRSWRPVNYAQDLYSHCQPGDESGHELGSGSVRGRLGFS
jgi:integrase